MQTINITYNTAAQLHAALVKMSNITGSSRFAYSVAKNIRLLDAKVSDIRRMFKPSDEVKKFDEERVALNVEYAQKENNGKPRTLNSEYVIDSERRAEFEEKMVELRACYEHTLDLHKEMMNNIEKASSDFVDVSVAMLKLSQIPDGVSAAMVDAISILIEDDEEPATESL